MQMCYCIAYNHQINIYIVIQMRALLKETFFKSKIKNKFLYLNSEKKQT